ncbi:MAG: hypothetical protein ACPHID_06245 [Thermoplasmatota archaeon]
MRAFSILAAGMFLLAGCAGQSAVNNNTNNFSYAGQAAGWDDVETYTWKNTMGTASVSWGGQVAEGSISVTIKDAAGKQVFSRGLSGQSQEGFSGDTASGLAGDWTIKLTFQDYTGQMGLNVRAGASGGSWSGGQGFGG